jgi:hypothetical protein
MGRHEVTATQVAKAKSKVYRHAPPHPAATFIPPRTRSRASNHDFTPCSGQPRSLCPNNVIDGVECTKCKRWSHLICAGFVSFDDAAANESWECWECSFPPPPSKTTPISEPTPVFGLHLLAAAAASPIAQLAAIPSHPPSTSTQDDLFAEVEENAEEHVEEAVGEDVEGDVCPIGLARSVSEFEEVDEVEKLASSPTITPRVASSHSRITSPSSTAGALAVLASPSNHLTTLSTPVLPSQFSLPLRPCGREAPRHRIVNTPTLTPSLQQTPISPQPQLILIKPSHLAWTTTTPTNPKPPPPTPTS